MCPNIVNIAERKKPEKAPEEEVVPGLWNAVREAKGAIAKGSGDYVVLYARMDEKERQKVYIGVAIQKKDGLYGVDGGKIAAWDSKLNLTTARIREINTGVFDPAGVGDAEWIPPLGFERTGSYSGKIILAEWQEAGARLAENGPSLGGRIPEFNPRSPPRMGAPEESTLGGKLKAQYEGALDQGQLGRTRGFYVFRCWTSGSDGAMRVVETGIAVRDADGDYIRTEDGTRVKGTIDFLYVTPGSEVHNSIGKGALEPKAGRGQSGWENASISGQRSQREITAWVEQYAKTHGLAVEEGEATGYYSPVKDQKAYFTGSYGAEKALQGDGSTTRSGLPPKVGTVAGAKEYSAEPGSKSYRFSLTAIDLSSGKPISIDSKTSFPIIDTGGAIKGGDADFYSGTGDAGYKEASKIGRRDIISIYAPKGSERLLDQFVLDYNAWLVK